MELGAYGMGPWGAVGQPADRTEEYAGYPLLAGVLGRMGVPPDFESDRPLRYTHRRTPRAEIYFVANRTEEWVGANCTFRVSGRRPELWDPLTGRISRPALYQERNGRVSLPLWLGPAGSVFVVFREASRSAAVASFSRDGRSLLPQAGRPLAEAPAAGLREVEPNTFALLARQPGRYELKTAGGRRLTASVPALPAPLAVNGPWEVRFQRGRGAPERLSLDALVDWVARLGSEQAVASGPQVQTVHP
jgi:hypothetical protein